MTAKYTSNYWPIKGTDTIRKLADGSLVVSDHLGGFDSKFKNKFLENLDPGVVHTEYYLTDTIKALYPHLTIKFDSRLAVQLNHFTTFVNCDTPPTKQFTNFLCCFNRAGHTSRQQLCWQLHVLDWFNPEYCSKNFIIPSHISGGLSVEFCQTIINFGSIDNPLDHQYNFQELKHKIQHSCINLVSETIGESFVPFPTEKMLYPITNKTLWLAYAQPGYHTTIQKLFGFKLHRCFDYAFDQISDPNYRLAALTDMLAPFYPMRPNEWHDIYLQEADILEFNFEHCRSGRFISHFNQFNESDRQEIEHIA